MGLQGARVLIVEDEPIISALLDDMISELGAHVVQAAGTLAEAQQAARCSELDAAVLDINLLGEMSYPAAEELNKRAIPFIFVTGFAAEPIPSVLAHVPVVSKPYTLSNIKAGLLAATRRAPACDRRGQRQVR
ncbi:hypothetical protein A7X12_16425 [Sphingomonas sp. TDK1]|nr:hypothetical protein A7X12_16425 [Sphingomonas sp. TDK1]